MTDDLRAEMANLGGSYKRAKRRYEDAQKVLIGRIPAWMSDGIKQREIVEATGLTREYVRQIVDKAKNRAPDLDELQRGIDALSED